MMSSLFIMQILSTQNWILFWGRLAIC